MEPNPPNPFKGLRPYKQEEQDSLFGRDRDLILMKDRIFAGRTTLLFAGSGVGKTSFLNAKIIPELRKQYVVIWHNRWTGADEDDNSQLADDQGIRFWPPRAMFRDLIRKFRGAGEDNLPISGTKTRFESGEDELESVARRAITLNLRQSSSDSDRKLSEVLATFKRSSKANSSVSSDTRHRDRCVLILDQFEEVFQYHAYEDYFKNFINDLCEIINNDDYQVRVVFSMREEFLGELSVFDNKIPDLFSNYYRLRYPDKDEAEDIIARTIQLSGVEPAKDKLAELVDDLSKIEKGGGSSAERSTERKPRVIKRNFVAPPYLQIACERLWNQQYASKETQPTVIGAGPGDHKEAIFAPFLVNYNAGNGSNEHEPGGDAQKALRDFCEEKLSSPFLSPNQQDIVARAFGFLVTKQGAKMAYELRSLAEHMEEPVRPLKVALEKLSQDDAKILRESRGPDRSYWFELYHDMYATIVEEWKVAYLKLRKRRRIRNAALGIPLVLFLVLLAFWFVINPRRDLRQLETFRDTISGANIQDRDDYGLTVNAFYHLRGTFGYRSRANSLWADILFRRAQWFQSVNDPSSAVLCLLRAATLESDSDKRQRHLKNAELVLGTENRSLLMTYCDDCTFANVSPDGEKVVTMNREGRFRLWETRSGEAIGMPFCDYCIQTASTRTADADAPVPSTAPIYRTAIFSADGTNILTAAAVSAETSQSRTPSRTSLKVQLWDTKNQNPVTKAFDVAVDASGEEGRRNIRVFALVDRKLWVAGIVAGRPYLWDESGTERLLADRLAAVTFNAGGNYLLVTPFRGPALLWEVTKDGATQNPLAELSNSVTAVFSPDGRKVLIAGKDNKVQLVDLASKAVLVVRSDKPVTSLGFSPSGSQFFTQSPNTLNQTESDEQLLILLTADIHVWDAASGKRLSVLPNSNSGAIRTILGPEGKTLLRVSLSPSAIEQRDAQTGQWVGVLKRRFRTYPPVLFDGTAALINYQGTTRLWGIDPIGPLGKAFDGKLNPGALSADGKVVAALNTQSKIQFWDVESGKPRGEPAKSEATALLIALRKFGDYAASVEHDEKIRVWQVGTPDPIATLAYSGEPNTMVFSSDGTVLSVAEEATITAWNIPGGTRIELSQGHANDVNAIAVSQMRMISGSDDNTARIWDLWSKRNTPIAHTAKVTAVAITNDGRKALTGTDDGMLRLWDAGDAQPIGGPIKFGERITGLTFSDDGRTVAVLTPSWMHICPVGEKGLSYKGGSLVAEQKPLLSIMDHGRFRFVYQAGPFGIQVQDLDQSAGLSILNGDPSTLLDTWEARLGFKISELGQIEKRWPQVQPPMPQKDPTTRAGT
jgi:WD40 repeat protein